jgi:multidrug resistance efflux pump
MEAARKAITENDVRLAEARVTLRRRQQLLKDGLATQADFDQAKPMSTAAKRAWPRRGSRCWWPSGRRRTTDGPR